MILSELPSVFPLCDSALWYLMDSYLREDRAWFIFVVWFISVKVIFYTCFLSALELMLVPVFVRIYYSFLRICTTEGCSEWPDKLFHQHLVLSMLLSGYLLCIWIFKHSIYMWFLSLPLWPNSRQFLLLRTWELCRGFLLGSPGLPISLLSV